MTSRNIALIEQELTPRGGALAKEFNRVRTSENLQWNVEKEHALRLMADNDYLAKSEPHTVARCLIDLATMGLSLSPARKEAYLIPYKEGATGKIICTLSPSYIGMEQTAYKSGFVEMIQTALVHENDPEFRVYMDDKGARRITHEEGRSQRGKVTHAYTISHVSSGKFHVEVMSRADIDACKEAAARKNNGQVPFTWSGKFRYEMYKKCCLRRAFKHWPKFTSDALRTMIESMDRSDPMEFEGKATIQQTDKITRNDIDDLVKVMEDAGVPDTAHDLWLAGLAKRFGYSKITEAKAERVEQLKATLIAGCETWLSKQESSTPQSSES